MEISRDEFLLTWLQWMISGVCGRVAPSVDDVEGVECGDILVIDAAQAPPSVHFILQTTDHHAETWQTRVSYKK